MKATFLGILTALAVSTIAAPTADSLAKTDRGVSVKRHDFGSYNMLKRADNEPDSVNVLRPFDDDARNDPYQDEVDAISDPASVLGKREDAEPDSVSRFVDNSKDDESRKDAYQDAVDAVADPADVLG
ncbi:hypothetical protein ACLMJK_008214 [Lecanora helva]